MVSYKTDDQLFCKERILFVGVELEERVLFERLS